MTEYFLGADIGSTNTRVLITDETGRPIGFGQSGPGNHEVVGYTGLAAALGEAAGHALSSAGLSKCEIAGAGFGVSGYDWPSERVPTLEAIGTLGLPAPVRAVNDAILGLLAGSSEGWGLALVAGTGCNCRGWGRDRRREGAVTGHGLWMGEGAGASELIAKTVQALAHEWTLRGPATQLTPAFLAYTGCVSLTELLEALIDGRKRLDASAAPLVFKVAQSGDPVAAGLIRWAGSELGELAKCVIRQLTLEDLEFEVVLTGSLFDGGPLLIEPLTEVISAYAPGARLVRLVAPPVAGAVLLGMEAGGLRVSQSLRLTVAAGALQAGQKD
jgi:N-acetylglucosamine kinase-like BadF-type ATPase